MNLGQVTILIVGLLMIPGAILLSKLVLTGGDDEPPELSGSGR